jgi:hypothetical protein
VLLVVTDRDPHPATDRGAIQAAEHARGWSVAMAGVDPSFLRADRILRLPVKVDGFASRVETALFFLGFDERLEALERRMGVDPGVIPAREPSAMREVQNPIPEADGGFRDPLDDPSVQVAFDHLLKEVLERTARGDLVTWQTSGAPQGRPAPRPREPREGFSTRLASSLLEDLRRNVLDLGTSQQELVSALIWAGLDDPGRTAERLHRFRRAQLDRERLQDRTAPVL